MDCKQEILDAIEIMIEKAMKNATKIQIGNCEAVNGDKCTMTINGMQFNNITFYGSSPIVNRQYRVFIPENNFNMAFIIVP